MQYINTNRAGLVLIWLLLFGSYKIKKMTLLEEIFRVSLKTYFFNLAKAFNFALAIQCFPFKMYD